MLLQGNANAIPFIQRFLPPNSKTGTVLGLRLSHQLVQLMGGKLDYRTEAGVGSSFFFTLPMYSPSEQRA
jgi:signal transduction histidine kinase